MVFLAAIVCSAQASTISGSSKITSMAELGIDLQLTFTSDVPTDQITSADFDMGTGGGANVGPSTALCPAGSKSYIGTPPVWPGNGLPDVQTFTIGYTGFLSGLTSHYCGGAEVAVPGEAKVTVHINGDCPLTGIYNEVPGALGYTATFSGICEGTPPPSIPEFPSLALPMTMIIGFIGALLFIQRTREH